MRKTAYIGILLVMGMLLVPATAQPLSDTASVTLKGGFGVKAVVENTGDTTLENISWEINVTTAGFGFVLFGHKTGTIETLAPGDTVTVPSTIGRLLPPTIGFGKVNITANVDGETSTATAFLAGMFFLSVK